MLLTVTQKVTVKPSEQFDAHSTKVDGILAVGIITGLLQLVVLIVLTYIVVLWIKKKK